MEVEGEQQRHSQEKVAEGMGSFVNLVDAKDVHVVWVLLCT